MTDPRPANTMTSAAPSGIDATCIVHGPEGVWIDTFPLRPLQPGEALVETTWSCISPGTELRELAKCQDAVGTIVPGYAKVGRVSVPADDGLPAGSRVVVCGAEDTGPHTGQWGGHISHSIVKADTLIPIPREIDDRQAVLARLGAIAMHGFRTTPRSQTDRVAVLGLGAIGLFSATFYACAGHHIVGFDRSAARVQLARTWGIAAEQVTGSTAEHIAGHFADGADMIIDATGVPAVLTDAVDALRRPAWGAPVEPTVRYVVQGSYPDEISLPYWSLFEREAQVHFPRDWEPGDLAAIFDLIRAGRLDFPESLYSVRRPTDAPDVYAALRHGPAEKITALFRWAE